MTVNGPDGLPADQTARLDQVHANVIGRLRLMVSDVAVNLRIDTESARPEQVAQTIAGQAARSDHASIATMFAGAIVLLAQQHNREHDAPPLPMPTEDDSFNTDIYQDRARAYCQSLVELMFRHGLVLTSVLDIGLYDPVAKTDIAQGLHFDSDLFRYQCTAVPPQEWNVQ